MGAVIQDSSSQEVLYQLNARFEPGEALEETVALQREFHIFSEAHSLRQSFALLNIGPAEWSQRRRWYRFLEENLRTYPSDLAGVDGHDKIVRALQEDLASQRPLPVYFTCHLARDQRGVVVTQDRPLVFSLTEYVVISIPTTPRRLARVQPAGSAPTNAPSP